jgi:hypothetical protein
MKLPIPHSNFMFSSSRLIGKRLYELHVRNVDAMKFLPWLMSSPIRSFRMHTKQESSFHQKNTFSLDSNRHL